MAKKDDNQGFILKHSVGSLPHGSEVDTPLNYADYYYLEALKRYLDMKNNDWSLIMRTFIYNTFVLKSAMLIICILSNALCFPANAVERHLLEDCIAYEDLGAAIRLDQSWVDYPAYKDRKAWEERVDPFLGEKIIQNGEKALGHEWRPALASDYLAFKRTGEIRTKRENHLALQALMLAELVEGKGRFMDAIMDGAWFYVKHPGYIRLILLFKRPVWITRQK